MKEKEKQLSMAKKMVRKMTEINKKRIVTRKWNLNLMTNKITYKKLWTPKKKVKNKKNNNNQKMHYKELKNKRKKNKDMKI